MQTGENDQAMRKILDMTRLISIVVLLLHFYVVCYGAFAGWHLVSALGDRLLGNVVRTGLFSSFMKPKLIALAFLVIALIGVKGKKDEKQTGKTAALYLIIGLFFFFASQLVLLVRAKMTLVAVAYMASCGLGFLLIMSGGTMLSKIIRDKLSGDIFNRDQETFPQEERLLENEFSVNLPVKYILKGKERRGWINFINLFRALVVLGSPGSGKSYFIIRHIITQHIRKGFAMFVYDFKMPDLAVIAYNTWLKYRDGYKVPPKFYSINFDDLSRSSRCNPLDPSAMLDLTDAVESARTILLGLNREWIKRQGDFFVESPINFLTAIIWYLRKYNDGEFCTLPHVIELMQADYDSLFTLLSTQKEIDVLINPFISAYKRDAVEQLEGQIASAKITMAHIASPQLYYVLSGNEFTLDINNPAAPKIVCMGNNPQKIQIYGAVLSLFTNRLLKIINQKDKLKCSLVFDEFPTLTTDIIPTISTGRSNLISTCLGIQDASQLRKDYGREQADVIMNIVGNMAVGQVSGDTAKAVSEKIGRIMQDRESLSINRSDTSISRSKQLEAAVPASRISALSSGEFVGMVADNPDCKIELKAFHCEIVNDHAALKKEIDSYVPLPEVMKINNAIVERNYLEIKQDIRDIIELEMERLLSDPALAYLIIKKAG
ncbi:type IV secretory system conjugative DNA transfer VirD4/TraG family protein [Mucilaginibacter yixingensis]|uniref:Type IV secretory system conjugative DNA transfer VirD4/TraG family protein n=1 Tax=Mucilaginibacter yixingensis TaxID=1295612 RepID=A0A2T5JBN8_9SPHI|nr:conjugal transfer protein MobC [Mucilaginibacter yixingensis]PTQ99192.1 type IV secretory system conjugative DNA transfer VirD4/TraG family protein [Mucilaginibacter yixingensis]